MIFRIKKADNTWLNALALLEAGGLKWSREDLDGSNAGRTLDGVMHRDRIATKIKLECTCLPLTNPAELLNCIAQEYVTVDYTDPQYGDRTGVVMYSNNNPATCAMVYDDGTVEWTGITFPLIEV